MALSSRLISQFAKMANDNTSNKTTTSNDRLYGEVVEYNGKKYVRLDGSDQLTPVETTVATKENDRVTVSIKNHTAIVDGNLSDPSASSGTVKEIGNQISEFEIIIADKVNTYQLEAQIARIDQLKAADVTITGELAAAQANIEILQAEDVTITGRLDVAEASIITLETEKVSTDFLEANYATIIDIEAVNANIINLESDVGDINTLIFGSASGTVIQTSFANAVIAQLGDATIKSAMIDSLSASKIKSGDIITNNVRVMSEDGSLIISDETMQISDNTRVRVQIGKDAAGDYSINIWDADGNLMFSEGGITDDAIKDAIIRDDMVSDTANISASKLDISSLFEVINEDDSHTLSSSKILIDADNQTLDVAFTNVTTDITALTETVTTQGTELTAVQGQISSEIWSGISSAQSTADTAIANTSTLSTQYTALEQTVNSIEATVASHTTLISEKADGTTVTTIQSQVTEIETSLDGFKSTVSETYVTKTDFSDSKLGNLVKNGYGEYLNNTNFSSAKFYPNDDTLPEGCYGYFNGAGTTEAIPYDPNMTYEYSFGVRLHSTTTGNTYFSLIPYDVDGLVLQPDHFLNLTSKLFYLAHDLAPGDTTVYFTDLTDWMTTSYEYQRSLRFYGYTDSTGYTYPDGTYSRYVYRNVYTDDTAVDTTNNTITLTSAWTGPTFKAGTCVMHSTSGATFVHLGQAGSLTSTDWLFKSGTFSSATDKRLLYAKSFKIHLYSSLADWCAIKISQIPIDSNARDSASDAQATASDAQSRVTVAESTIRQLSNAISTLITDENGASLMTQTTDGWTFCMGDLLSSLESAASTSSSNSEDILSINSTISGLQTAVDDLGALANYVRITTSGDEPCIEMGESDSDFKLRITNTGIEFSEGSTVVAYMTNTNLSITKAVIEEELTMGGFVWQVRDSGNLGLSWKG